MPFTFSHPALIIPLLHAQKRFRWLSATGLITGSIAPDFEKFFKLDLASGYSHTLASIFYFSCPVSLALAFLFHLVVRRPLLAHLPEWLRRRVFQYALFNWPLHFRQHYVGVLLSIVLGAVSHLLWDSFTHPNYVMVKFLPWMATPVLFGGREVPLYQVSGLVSTVLGGLILAWAIWRLPLTYTGPLRAPATFWQYWGLAAGLALTLVVQWTLIADPRWLSIGITGISASMVGILVASVYILRRKSPTPGPAR